MDRGGDGRDEFFRGDDLFARPGGLISSIFGGRDPFADDPFFTRPSGSSIFSGMAGHLFSDPMNSHLDDLGENAFVREEGSRGRGPVIRELSDDDELEDQHGANGSNSRVIVQEPDPDEAEEGSEHVQFRRRPYQEQENLSNRRNITFHSSSVTYGGINGAYYTSSTTRRAGSDGITIEESKEADTTTGKATHRVSRGINDKGHSVTRRMNPDGKVDTMQTLHNMEEEELVDFEDKWKGNAMKFGMLNSDGAAGGNGRSTVVPEQGRSFGGGRALTGGDQPSETAGRPKSRVIPIV